ncbi:MAG: isoprenylcysteine carboxylmethyltransferase family protein [Xanthomonadales bacterium]|nr:isoprenylcysteine carboxylmethyltransferase family protein [Xanthomonadales bacterium]NNK37295.1 isoprenylcysteine carboxylmethyltransferase family protein [Xanthomonadales bacterium]
MPRLQLKVPPAIQLVIAAGLMWGLAELTPDLGLDRGLRTWLYRGLTVLGGLVVVRGWWDFRRARTTVDPTRPHKASSLVVTGAYRFSRNPMYLGFLLLLIGWAAFLDNAYSLAALPLIVLSLTQLQIRPEEDALQSRFGSDWEDYARRVRRWI